MQQAWDLLSPTLQQYLWLLRAPPPSLKEQEPRCGSLAQLTAPWMTAWSQGCKVIALDAPVKDIAVTCSDFLSSICYLSEAVYKVT